jgi:hypothetical protein
MAKTRSILILFTLLESSSLILHLLVRSVLYEQRLSPTPSPHPAHLQDGENEAAVKDGIPC